jgi:uncharacterized protein (DUF1810 family)
MADPFDLQRFVDAQAPVWADVTHELAAGRKASHWMWFVFPQLAALGRSSTARHYGIRSIEEARAYAMHPLLGRRLVQCAEWLLAVPAGRSAHDVMGSPDDLKLRSSMTLFERVWPAQPQFLRVLERFFGGVPDPLTIELLER